MTVIRKTNWTEQLLVDGQRVTLALEHLTRRSQHEVQHLLCELERTGVIDQP